MERGQPPLIVFKIKGGIQFGSVYKSENFTPWRNFADHSKVIKENGLDGLEMRIAHRDHHHMCVPGVRSVAPRTRQPHIAHQQLLRLHPRTITKEKISCNEDSLVDTSSQLWSSVKWLKQIPFFVCNVNAKMFQCIIQHSTTIYNAPELKHVFPGNHCQSHSSYCFGCESHGQ